MNGFIKDSKFYRTFFTLTISIALQNLLTYSVNLADNIMIGRYSQNALSAVAICNQFQFFLQMLVVGVGEGVVVLGAQYWGKGDIKPIKDIIGAGMRFGLIIACFMFFCALLIPETILGFISNDQAVIKEAVKYMQIVCFTYLIFTAANTLTASLRSIGIVKIGYIISFSTLCINTILNYCLIYGNLGFPELGIRGAAIATLISRTVELIIVAFFLKYKEKKLQLTLKALIYIDTSYIHDYIHVSLPLLITQATWGLAQLLQTAIIGNLKNSASVIAANSIAVLTFQIISVIGYGAASAAAMLTGKAVGKNDMINLKKQTFTFQVIFLILGIFCGIGIWSTKYPILSFYPALDLETQKITLQFISVMAVTSIGTCYQMAADVGIIRAGGSPSFSMINNTIFMWIIVIPAAFLTAYVLELPAVFVFFCLKSNQLLKCPVIFIYVNSYKWIKNVTRPTL